MLTIATVQSIITPGVASNGGHIRALMQQAAAAGATIAHFPEAALSGYADFHIRDWSTVDWAEIESELDQIARLAASLRLWVVLGCNHRLPAPQRPHNSVYVISDRGERVARYNKRFCSNAEVTYWYTPGTDPVVFDVAGIRFGVAVCIEVAFPTVFADYEAQQVHCMLVPCFSADPAHGLMARAHAATNCTWLSLATPVGCSATLPSQIIGPDGEVIASGVAGRPSIALATIDLHDSRYQVPLTLRRPWRARARSGEIYAGLAVS